MKNILAPVLAAPVIGAMKFPTASRRVAIMIAAAFAALAMIGTSLWTPTVASGATVKNFTVEGRVLATYTAAGGEKKFGKPVSAETKVTISGVSGYSQKFAKGEVFYSSKGSQTFRYPSSPNLTGITNERDALAIISFARGKLYRNANMCKASWVDKLTLAGMLHGGRIIDLRTSGRIKECPDPSLPGVTKINRSINGDAVYSRYITDSARRATFKKVLYDATDDNDPVLIHCTAGKDRTGWAVAMIMYAAGATDTQVRTEYRRTADVDAAKLKEFDAAITLAKKTYGSMRAYIRTGLGVSAARYVRLTAKFGPQK